ncbi:hypothetical protein FB451DRAFT_1416806 [Mycena latifolia]|nr:hypothetical protein FB451DRAFT_1416806 [Mycena latifolia]
MRATEQEDKQTKGMYARHVSHYETFWKTTSSARGDNAAGLAPIPAFPITIAKAVIFLQYESTHPQKKRRRKATDDEDDTHEASSIGVSGLKQAISALEHWRFNNQHLYKEIADAQAGLRVKAFELNRRQQIREEITSNDKGWNSIHVTTNKNPKRVQGETSLAGVDFEMTSVGDCSKVAIAV